MKLYTMSEADLTRIANQSKELIIDCLIYEKYLTPEEAEVAVSTYALVVRRPGWFGQILDKLRGVKPNDPSMIEIVKLVPAGNFDFDENKPYEEEEDVVSSSKSDDS